MPTELKVPECSGLSVVAQEPALIRVKGVQIVEPQHDVGGDERRHADAKQRQCAQIERKHLAQFAAHLVAHAQSPHRAPNAVREQHTHQCRPSS